MERKLTSLERSENKESLRVSYSRRMSLPPQSLEHPWEMRGKRVKALVFPVVIYGCERWTIKKAEHWRIDAFELWCWRRLLRVPWTARRSNQSILKEISPAYSLESLTLKLKPNPLATWCEELTHWKNPWCWKDLKTGEGDDRGGNGWMASLTQWTWVWVNSVSWWWTGRPGMLQSMGSQRVRHDRETELNWTEGNGCINFILCHFFSPKYFWI